MTFRLELTKPSTFSPHRAGATRLDFGKRESAPALPKCSHSIYLATLAERASGLAHHCGFCNLSQHYGALGGNSRTVLFAKRYLSTPRSERVTANRHDHYSNTCPQCGSSYRYVLENSKDVECSDCGKHWRPIRRGDSLATFEEAA